MVLYPASDRKRTCARDVGACDRNGESNGNGRGRGRDEQSCDRGFRLMYRCLCFGICELFIRCPVEEEAETVLYFIASVQEERQRRYIRRIFPCALTLKSCLYRRKRNKMKESPV